MNTRSKLFKIVSTSVLAIITVVALYLSNTFLNFDLGKNGTTVNFANILVFTVGIFWMFAFLTDSVKKMIYFWIGIIMILVSLMLFTHETINNISFIENTIFYSYSIVDSIALCFAGLYLMIYSYVKG
ncbi:hypothetical protein K9M50_03790 [Patescibacteria group bacterium]|nr:hypothetical protein [Patescibacteria group bacterium]